MLSPALLTLSILGGGLLGMGLILLLMRPRRFYFVRHGETVLNAEHLKQGEEGGLSESGKQQAQKVGRYLARFGIGRIISSTYPRARETALIINETLRVPITYSPLFVERRNPKEIIGKNRDLPEVVRIVDQIELAYHDDDYRYADEENFSDLKKRAKKCLALLALQSRSTTCIVTHHVFLKMCVEYLLYRERLHAKDFTKLSFFNVSDNAGITVCEFHPWRMFSKTRGWEVVSYNEQPT
jgi:broad specificity phosphatase PhoE